MINRMLVIQWVNNEKNNNNKSVDDKNKCGDKNNGKKSYDKKRLYSLIKVSKGNYLISALWLNFKTDSCLYNLIER